MARGTNPTAKLYFYEAAHQCSQTILQDSIHAF